MVLVPGVLLIPAITYPNPALPSGSPSTREAIEAHLFDDPAFDNHVFVRPPSDNEAVGFASSLELLQILRQSIF